MGFTKRRLRISLSSTLKSITGIYHPTSYCSFTISNLQITLTSEKPGIGYLYLNGILNINDNKAVVLLIVIIAENGSLSTGDPLIFTVDPNFDKEPTTTQKELNTYSSIEGLDTSEPEENPNITPCVNTEEINQLFSKFDYEDDILPRIFVGFCIKKNQWCINYTKDTEVKEDSEFILYETSYDGLLDCLNICFDLLTNNRTTKERIAIITSGSTGSAKVNQYSQVRASNRNNTSVSIQPNNYTILDFQNNYIYIDTSETFTANSKTFNIKSLINMERGINNVTICNGYILGSCGYGIFMANCYDILIKNFHFQIAKGEYKSCFLGIRAQSQATAAFNVELTRWSHDIYLDNINFDGIEDHGFEIYNAYNVYAKTIRATDVGGCGILLNCSYNVWINEVIGKRCCAGGSYAVTRYANDCGPNINIHYIYGEACGNGVFLVSSSNGITVDKVNLINTHLSPIYVSGSGGLRIQSGKISTNNGELKYSTHDGKAGNTLASKGSGTLLVNGTTSQFFPQWNNVFENIKIEGYKVGYSERYKMSANYNIYNNIDTSKCNYVKSAEKNGTGTNEDIGFNFCVIDGQKGEGYDEITGDKIVSENYTYSLASSSDTYVIMEYNGDEENIIIPSQFNGKNISRVGSFAFYGNGKLKTLTINSNIESIGGLSFGACSNLESITFSSGGKCQIGHCAFRGCEKLINLDLAGASELRASCFAWCIGLKEVVCPKNVVYFGANIFFNCNIKLTIECDDKSLMTVEPYAFYYMGRNSSISFTGVTEPTDLTSVIASANKGYYYNSHSYVEQKCYKPGVWCKNYQHCAIPINFVKG